MCCVDNILVVVVVVAVGDGELVATSIEKLERKQSYAGTAAPLSRRSPAVRKTSYFL